MEAALASDAARLITDALEKAPEESKIEAKELNCDSEETWEVGEDFTNHLLTVKYNVLDINQYASVC